MTTKNRNKQKTKPRPTKPRGRKTSGFPSVSEALVEIAIREHDALVAKMQNPEAVHFFVDAGAHETNLSIVSLTGLRWSLDSLMMDVGLTDFGLPRTPVAVLWVGPIYRHQRELGSRFVLMEASGNTTEHFLSISNNFEQLRMTGYRETRPTGRESLESRTTGRTLSTSKALERGVSFHHVGSGPSRPGVAK